MNDHRCSALVLLLLAPTVAVRAADDPASSAPLPTGAKIRLGTSRSTIGMDTYLYGAHLLAPDYRNVPDRWRRSATGPLIRDIFTGKTTDVPGFEAAEPGKERPDGRTVFAVSADGKRAVTERAPDAYLVFEVATGKAVRVVKAPGGVGVWVGHEVRPVSLSADGKVMAFDAAGKGATRDVIVWNVEKDVQLARVSAIQNQNVTPVLSPDGKMLATRGRHEPPNAASDGVTPGTALQLWDVSAGKLIATIRDVFPGFGAAVAFSPDGKTVATASQSDGAIQLWDATTGKPGLLLLGRSQQGVVLAFSPDGKTLATLGQTGAIDRWALPDGKPLKPTLVLLRPSCWRSGTARGHRAGVRGQRAGGRLGMGMGLEGGTGVGSRQAASSSLRLPYTWA